MSAIFKTWEPDPYGVILGTGYMRFTTDIGIDGLAKINGDRLDVLAVHAETPGKGQFRKFIEECKNNFREICVWEDFNPIVGVALKRYGFEPTMEVEFGGVIVDGWRYVS